MNRQITTDKEERRHNSGFAKKRVQWLIEHSTSYQILWYIDSLVLRNPLLRQAPNRRRQPYGDSANLKPTEKKLYERFIKINFSF